MATQLASTFPRDHPFQKGVSHLFLVLFYVYLSVSGAVCHFILGDLSFALMGVMCHLLCIQFNSTLSSPTCFKSDFVYVCGIYMCSVYMCVCGCVVCIAHMLYIRVVNMQECGICM